MATMDTGIRTQAGKDLFSRVNSGQTKIHYDKIVFSSVDLTGKSNDEIRQMTDIQPQELTVDKSTTRLQVLNQPTSDQRKNPETDIRAIAVNDPLTSDGSGYYVRTYALYASDDNGDSILYGVSLDSHPAYMPQFQGQEQRLAYDWDEDTTDQAQIEFTNVHTAYATWWDFQRFSSVASQDLDDAEARLTSNNTSLAASVNADMTSADSKLTSHSESMTSYANSMSTSLTNSVNGLPHWNDENWTRNQVVPSVANSYATSAGASAISQANANMEANRTSLSNYAATLPTWADENWTRGNANNLAESAKSAADSHANDISYNAFSEAESAKNAGVTTANNAAANLQNQVTDNRNKILSSNTLHPFISKKSVRNSTLDCNKCLDIGEYSFYSSKLENAPQGEDWGFGTVDVMANSDSDYNDRVQVLRINSGSTTNTRYYVRTVWVDNSVGQWVRLATNVDVSNLQDEITHNWDTLNNHNDNLQGQINRNYNSAEQASTNLQNQVTSNKNSIISSNNLHPFISKKSVRNDVLDLNKCLNVGEYSFYSSKLLNAPSGTPESAIGVVYVVSGCDSDDFDRVQVMRVNGGGASDTNYFTRTVFVDNSFGRWVHLATNSDITNVQNNANNAATNAMNQANAYTNSKSDWLEGQVTHNWNTLNEYSNSLQNQINDINSITPNYREANVRNGTLDLNKCLNLGSYAFYSAKLYNTPKGTLGSAFGSVSVLPSNYGDVNDRVQRLIWNNGGASDNHIYYRTIFVDNSFGRWNPVTDQVQIANDEYDAQNQSNQNPGVLVVYPD